MARSRKKGPYVNPKLLAKVIKLKEAARAKGTKTPVRIALKVRCRDCTIVPEFIHVTFDVYNGKIYIPVLITEDLIGHKLGEFSPTRTYRGHSQDRKTTK